MLVLTRLVVGRLGSRGIEYSGSRKVLLGLIENRGEDSKKLGWVGEEK